jgi:hypothetical protein
MGSPETSVSNHSTPRNSSEGGIIQDICSLPCSGAEKYTSLYRKSAGREFGCFKMFGCVIQQTAGYRCGRQQLQPSVIRKRVVICHSTPYNLCRWYSYSIKQGITLRRGHLAESVVTSGLIGLTFHMIHLIFSLPVGIFTS